MAMDDITKYGPATYKQLQEQNDLNSNGKLNPKRLQEIVKELDLDVNPGTVYDPFYNAEQEVTSPLTQNRTRIGTSDYWGRSHWDEGIATAAQFERLGDIRAENQPWYSKLTNGIGKAGVLAVTTAVEGAGILIGGIPQGIINARETEKGGGRKVGAFIHGLWDNPITEALQNINEYAEDIMPNYYTQDEMENPWSNIFTANFLGDKLIKNVGFMVGAFYGGLPAAKAIGKVGVKAVKGARLANQARLAGMAARADDIAKEVAESGLKGAAKTARTEKLLRVNGLTEADKARVMREGLDKINKAAHRTRVATQTVGVVGSAINEGAIEAINNSKDWADLEIDKEDARYQQDLATKFALIEQQYGGTELEQKLKTQVMMDAAEEHNKRMEEIEQGRAKVGNADLLLNLPILIGTNAFELGNLYSRGFKATRRQTGSMLNGHRLPGNLKNSTLASSKTRRGAFFTAFVKNNTEGLEEYLQRAASDGPGSAVSESLNRYWDSGRSEEATNNVNDYIASFGRAAAENLGDPSAWEEYFIGALSAAIGMPTFGKRQNTNAWVGKGKAVGLSNGFVGEYKAYKAEMDRENSIAKYLNDRVKDPKFKALYDNLRKRGDIEALMKGALLEDDINLYKDLEYEKLIDDIDAAAASGHLGEFIELIKYNDDYSDEELDDIVKTTTVTTSAEDQKKADLEKKNYYEKQIKDTQAKKKKTDEDNVNLDFYKKQLAEVNKRLSDDDYVERNEGPFIIRGEKGQTIGMNTTEPGRAQMRKILKKNQENLLENINTYLALRNDIDIETDGNLTDEQIRTLTRLRGQIFNMETRSGDMAYDIITNLGLSVDDFEKSKERFSSRVTDAQNELKAAESALDKARKEEKKNIKSFEEDVLIAKNSLDRAKTGLREASAAVEFLKALYEEKETTAKERVAYEEGLGGGALDKIRARFDTGRLRSINSDELQAIVRNPNNARALETLVLAFSKNDNETKVRLVREIEDLMDLANKKVGYNKQIREWLNDPSLINESALQHEDELTQKQKDEQAEELSLRFRDARSLTELDKLYRESERVSPEITDRAFQKATESSDENGKTFLNEYIKAKKFYEDFLGLAGKLEDGEVRDNIFKTVNEEWHRDLIGHNNLYDTFVNGLWEFAKEYKKTPLPVAKKTGETMEKLLKELETAASSVATNKDVKKGTTKKGTTSTPKEEKKEAKVTSEEKKEEKKPKYTADQLKERISKEIKDSFNVDTQTFNVNSIKELSNDLQEAIEEYNETAPDGFAINDADFSILYDTAVDDRIVDESYDINETSDAEASMEEERETRSAEMKENLRSHFKSDHPTQYTIRIGDSALLDYKLAYPYDGAEFDDRLLAIQNLLKDYKAYDFVDKNFLGYIAKESEDGHPTVYFLKSTDENVDGTGGTDATVFMAIKWDDSARQAVTKHAFKGRSKQMDNQVHPVTIDGEQYHIVGVLSIARDVTEEVSTAFGSLVNAINAEVNPKLQEARDNNQPFVMSSLTSTIDQINTGRLEKKSEEKDSGGKISLREFVGVNGGDNASNEWASKAPFYFGVVVNGQLSIADHGSFNSEMITPSDAWMQKHNGSLVLFVPKADGKYYPINVTRSTVREWLADDENKELLARVIANPKSNEYLGNIVTYIKTLFSDTALIGTKMNAKMMLSKYFNFAKQSPIHFDENGVVLVLDDNEYVVSGSTIEEKVSDFFRILGEANVQFSLPSPTIEDVNGRSIIESSPFVVGLRGFYNFNANFTVNVIDGNGNPVSVGNPVEEGSHFEGSSASNPNEIKLDLGDGMKTYIISENEVTVDGKPVSTDEANLVLLIKNLNDPDSPALDFNTYMLDVQGVGSSTRKLYDGKLEKFSNLYVIDNNGTKWIVDKNKVNHDTPPYRLDSDKGKKLMAEWKNERGKIAFEDGKSAIEELGKTKKSPETAGSTSEKKAVQDNPLKGEPKGTVVKGGTMFAGRDINSLNTKNEGLEGYIAANKSNPIVRKVYKALQTAEQIGTEIKKGDVLRKLKSLVNSKADQTQVDAFIAKDIQHCK